MPPRLGCSRFSEVRWGEAVKKSFDFKERYAELDDETLAFILIDGNLAPEAEQALQEELSKRGIDDVSSFKDPAKWQICRDDLKALREMPLWRRISVPLSGFVALGIMGQGYFLPRYYVYEHYGPVIVGLELAVMAICLSWMLAHTPKTPKG